MDGTVDRETLRARLRAARVGIAGAGGLGSNCAAALARAGVGSLVIADFDTVSEGNLDRQFYFLDQLGRPKVEALAENLARIDPSVRVTPVTARLDADRAVELFSACDLVVEAFDDAGAKAMLIEAMGARLPAVPLVAASGLAGWGASGDIRVRRMGTLVLVGDESREACESLPPMAPRVGIVAAMQANEALRILLGPMDGGLMTITLNGERTDIGGAEASVRAVLAAKGWSFPLIIVKVNGGLVGRGDWDSFAVRDGDAMDAIHLVSGG